MALGAEENNREIVRPSSIVEGVYERIYERLMSLEIAPGARITIGALASDLNVSQTPVREALSRLEREGLVRKAHLIGYSAAPQLTRKEFDDLYTFRLLLEPEVARMACRNMTPELLQSLELVAADMNRGKTPEQRNSRYYQFAQADAHFHEAIAKIAGNDVISHALTDQNVHLHIFRLMFHSRVTQEALEEHESLLAAFRSGDPDAACEAMHVHISRSRDRLLAAFE